MSPSPASPSSTDARGRGRFTGSDSRSVRLDLIVGLALFVAAAVAGGWYVTQVVRSGGKPRFYQEQFAPAVMMACGSGYVNADADRSPALAAFLRVETDTVACTDDLRRLPTIPLTSMQRAFRYLMMTVGGTWRLQERIAWSALTPLYGLLYAITVVLAYAIFRQGMRAAIAGPMAAALMVSSLHLSYLAHLRDYAKAPFVLGLVLLAMRCVAPPASTRRLLTLAAIAGLVTGVGIGFRNDLMVAAPAFVALFLLFVALPARERIVLKVAAALVYVAVVVGALAPMLTIYRTGGGNSSQHLVLLGLGEPFTDELGIDIGRMYAWGYDYKDELAHAMISSYADRRLGEHRYLAMYGADYDRAASRYLWDIARNFPADMLVRVYGSALRILELPYSGTAVQPPPFIQSHWIATAYSARMRIIRDLAPFWPWTILLTLVALSVWEVRAGLVAALMVLYLSGYPALQFNERHYFHLEFIGWWALGFTVSQVVAAAAAVVDRARHGGRFASPLPPGWGRRVAVAAAMWGAAAAILLGPLYVLRRYQQDHVARLLDRYVAAPEDPLPLTHTPPADGIIRFDGPSSADTVPPATGDDVVHGEYIVAEFGGERCDTSKMDVTFKYTATEPQHDFSRTIQVQPPADGRTQVFFPAYSHRARADEPVHSGYGLAGLELPESAAGCVTKLARVHDTRELPVLMQLQLPPRWREATLYGTLIGLESRRDGTDEPVIHTYPASLTVPRAMTLSTLRPIDRDDVVRQSGTVSITDRGWRVSGVGGRGRFLYLAETKPRHVERGSIVLARGRLVRGGISFGLVRDGGWVAQVSVTVPGEFIAVVEAPDDGEYEVALGNYVVGPSLRYEVAIDRAGWALQAHRDDH